jgi:hypothetical protein
MLFLALWPWPAIRTTCPFGHARGRVLGIVVPGAPVLATGHRVAFLLLLSENCRVPFDDPNTHLELTMIHEVMVLDHGGPDLASSIRPDPQAVDFLGRTASLSCPPRPGPSPGRDLGAWPAFLGAVAVGVTESIMARLR